jgi:hypothetical protein
MLKWGVRTNTDQIKRDKLYDDMELQAAFAELKQRQQDFELAEDRFVKSAALYLQAAHMRVNELVRERRQGAC